MNKKEQEIFMECEKARQEQASKYHIILEYILNKNSHPMPDGVDFEKMFDEVQDFEKYLLEEAI